jgi:hypothetical protein
MARKKKLKHQKVGETLAKPPEELTVGLLSDEEMPALPSSGDIPQGPFRGSGTSLELFEEFQEVRGAVQQVIRCTSADPLFQLAR